MLNPNEFLNWFEQHEWNAVFTDEEGCFGGVNHKGKVSADKSCGSSVDLYFQDGQVACVIHGITPSGHPFFGTSTVKARNVKSLSEFEEMFLDKDFIGLI